MRIFKCTAFVDPGMLLAAFGGNHPLCQERLGASARTCWSQVQPLGTSVELWFGREELRRDLNLIMLSLIKCSLRIKPFAVADVTQLARNAGEDSCCGSRLQSSPSSPRAPGLEGSCA